MKLKINDIKVGDKIYVLDMNYPTYSNIYIYECEVEYINMVDQHLYEFKKDFIVDEINDKIFSDVWEAIDELRYTAKISDFNDFTIYLYMPYIIDAIDNNIVVSVIKEDKNHVRRLVECCITGIKYDDNTKEWKIKLTEKNKFKVSWFTAKQLGLTIFFSYEKALKKYNSLNK